MLEASSLRARHGEKETTSFVVAAAADAGDVRPRERAAERSAHRYVARLINFATAFNANSNFVGNIELMHVIIGLEFLCMLSQCSCGFTLGPLVSSYIPETVQ